MSEEMNRHEAELNEAALESVSGGGTLDKYEARDFALTFCGGCDLRHKVDRNQHVEMLTSYLMEHGVEVFPSFSQCPYFER